MERADCLPAEDSRIPGEVIHNGRRHGDAGQDRQRPEDEDHREIGDLLQRVVAIKAVRLRPADERSRSGPRYSRPADSTVGEVGTRRFHCSVVKSMATKIDAAKDEAMHVDEVPARAHADGVPVAGRANERREIAGIVLRRPEAVASGP